MASDKTAFRPRPARPGVAAGAARCGPGRKAFGI